MKTLQNILHPIDDEIQNNEICIKKSFDLLFHKNEVNEDLENAKIIELKENIDLINAGYMRILDLVSDLFLVEETDLENRERLRITHTLNLLKSLDESAFKLFNNLIQKKNLKADLKNEFLDFEININSIKEIIEDIDGKFIHVDEEANEKINYLLAQL